MRNKSGVWRGSRADALNTARPTTTLRWGVIFAVSSLELWILRVYCLSSGLEIFIPRSVGEHSD